MPRSTSRYTIFLFKQTNCHFDDCLIFEFIQTIKGRNSIYLRSFFIYLFIYLRTENARFMDEELLFHSIPHLKFTYKDIAFLTVTMDGGNAQLRLRIYEI